MQMEKKADSADCAANHLLSKLSKRANTTGIIMPMSGFAGGAVKDVEDSANQKLILLFGGEGIKKTITSPGSLEDLLNEKYEELTTRRRVVLK